MRFVDDDARNAISDLIARNHAGGVAEAGLGRATVRQSKSPAFSRFRLENQRENGERQKRTVGRLRSLMEDGGIDYP